jgi:hypothetical protein
MILATNRIKVNHAIKGTVTLTFAGTRLVYFLYIIKPTNTDLTCPFFSYKNVLEIMEGVKNEQKG